MNNSPTPQEPSREQKNRRGIIADLLNSSDCDNLCIILATYFSKHQDRPADDKEDTELGWGNWVMARTDAALDVIDAHCAKQVREAVARCPDCCGTGRISADQERDITEPCETCGGTGTSAGIRARANLADEMAGALERLLNTKNLLDLTPIFDAARSVLTKFNSAKAGQK